MSIYSPYTRVITSRNKRVFVKDKRSAYLPEIKRIEAEMKYIFFHEKATGSNVNRYRALEDQWKELKKVNK